MAATELSETFSGDFDGIAAVRLLLACCMEAPKRIVYILKNTDDPPRFYTGVTCDLGNLRLNTERRLVDQTFASSNPLVSWLRRIEQLMRAA